MRIEFEHVTTESTVYEIELTDKHKRAIQEAGYNLDDEEQHDDIIEFVINYDYNWLELSNDVVDGHFHNEKIKEN